jgi:hypothetical protein
MAPLHRRGMRRGQSSYFKRALAPKHIRFRKDDDKFDSKQLHCIERTNCYSQPGLFLKKVLRAVTIDVQFESAIMSTAYFCRPLVKPAPFPPRLPILLHYACELESMHLLQNE